MLFKWIDCRLNAAKKEAFTQAQAGWKAIQNQPGFGGQFGGWMARPEADQLRARIVGLWQDQECHRQFLEGGVHDSIVREQNLDDLLEDWKVDFLQHELAMPGQFPDLTTALHHVSPGAWLRVAECRVPPTQASHFWQAQEEIWRPAMESAPGMLGGCVATSERNILVLTLWESRARMEAYRRQTLPAVLAQCAQRGALPASLVDGSLGLCPDWTVPASEYPLN